MKRLARIAKEWSITFFLCVVLFAAFAGALLGACIVGVIYAIFGGRS